MQNIDNPSDNPLKSTNQNNANQLTELHNTTNPPKSINPKLLLLFIPILLGLLSLIATTIVSHHGTDTTIKPTPTTIPLSQETTKPDPATQNKWQQELNLILQQINQSYELTPPNINPELTF